MAKACGGKNVLGRLHSYNSQINVFIYLFVTIHQKLRFKEYLNKNTMKWALFHETWTTFFPTFDCSWEKLGCQSLQLKYGTILSKKKKKKCPSPIFCLLFTLFLCTKLLIHLSAGCSLSKNPYIFHSPLAWAWVWARKHHLTFEWIASGCLLCRL